MEYHGAHTMYNAGAPGQDAAPPSALGAQQLPPLPGQEWQAVPPLPEGAPPLPEDASHNLWAPPPDLLQYHQQQQQQEPQLMGPQPGASGAPSYPPWAGSVASSHLAPGQYEQQYQQAPPWAAPGQQQPPGYYPHSAYPQQQQQAAPSPYAQMYGQAWAQQQQQPYHHQPAPYGASPYPAPGYGIPYPQHPYQQADGAPYGGAYPGVQQQQDQALYQQQQQHGTAWGAAQHLQHLHQQQQPQQLQQHSWPAAAPASNGRAHGHGTPPVPGSPAPAQAAAAPSPERRPPQPANVTPVQALLAGPGRAARPKRIAVVLRGLPGSGKSHAARRLRDAEVAAGGDAPRIHSIDDYFVTEVEKEVWVEEPGGKRRRKTVQQTEYCYEGDMEGVYKGSLLKAFRRTVEEGRFGFVIVDANNLRAEDFKPYWDAGQRAGYEVYILQMPETSVQVCLKRNVHGRLEQEIEAAARQLEPVPPSMPQLDASSWLRNSNNAQRGIQEVDMEEDDSTVRAGRAHSGEDEVPDALKASRWASVDEGEAPAAKRAKRGQATSSSSSARQDVPSALRGPGQRKSVRWADEAPEDGGFAIGGAALRQLETVYVLEGLGPPKDLGTPAPRSFADQVKDDRKVEQRNFRDVLFGRPQAARPS